MSTEHRQYEMDRLQLLFHKNTTLPVTCWFGLLTLDHTQIEQSQPALPSPPFHRVSSRAGCIEDKMCVWAEPSQQWKKVKACQGLRKIRPKSP